MTKKCFPKIVYTFKRPETIGRRKIVNLRPHEFVPSNNIWSLSDFRGWYANQDCGDIWYEDIFPAMKKILAETLKASVDGCSKRKNTFEFFGVDFMLDKNNKVYLIEINRSPDPSFNTKESFDKINNDKINCM